MDPIGEARDILIVASQERGGVSEAVAAVAARLGGSWIDTKPVERTLRLLATSRAPVVHLHPSLRTRAVARDSVLHGVAKGRGAATVVHWHGWDRSLAHHLSKSGWMRAVLRSQVVGGLASADVVAVTTREQRDAWIEWGVAEHAVHVVANAFDPERIPTGRVLGGPPVVLFLGRLTAGKGVVELVEAFAHSHVDALLVIAGDGPARADVLRMIGMTRCSDRVVLAGWIGTEQIRYWLARASALVLPSGEESAPVAVIEALAARVPVVACRVGAVPDLVGDAGILLDRVDLDTLSAAIAAILDHPPLAALDRAAHRIHERHHPSAVATVWASLHAAAIERRR